MSESFPLTPEALLQHREFLRGLARGLLADDAGVDDVVQEAYVRALQRPPRSEDALRSWLARVVRNLALNRLRGEGRRAVRERDVARREAVPSSAEVADRLDTQKRVVDAVQSLHEPYRTVIYLRWYENLPPREIALRLERPIETVRSQLKRGHALLREELDEQFGGRALWAGALAPLAQLTKEPALPPAGQGGPAVPGSSTGFGVAWGAAAWSAVGVAVALVAVIVVAARPSGEASPASLPSALSPSEPLSFGARPESVAMAAGVQREPVRQSLGVATLPSEGASAIEVRGRCVRARGGEPLADVLVEILGPRETGPGLDTGTDTETTSELSGHVVRERVVTDAAGYFRSLRPQAARPVRLRFRNGPKGRVMREVDLPPEALDDSVVELDVGPTFRIDVDLPPGLTLADLRATLADPNVPGAPSAPSAVVETWLREGPVPWARFPSTPEASLMHAGGRSIYALRVESRDGAWGAVRRVHATPGVYPDVLQLTLEPQGSVRFVLPFRPRIESPIVLELSSTHQPTLREQVWASGECEFQGLRPGRFHLRTLTGSVEPYEQELVVGLDRVLVDLPLVQRDVARVEVVLTSRSGTHRPQGPMIVEPVDPVDARAEPFTHHGFADLGHTLLPHGEYILKPPMEDGLPWEPASQRITVPGPPVAFECLDDVDRVDLVLHVVDEETGERIEGARSVVLVDRYRQGVREAATFDAELPQRSVRGDGFVMQVPNGFPIAWVVEAEGYSSVRGDLSDLAFDGERLVGEVRLPPSWKARFWFGTHDEDGRPQPLGGVRVLTSGGKVLGSSLMNGELQLELLYDPGRLSVAYDDGGGPQRWRVTSWEGFLFGKRRAVLDTHRVWLKRDR